MNVDFPLPVGPITAMASNFWAACVRSTTSANSTSTTADADERGTGLLAAGPSDRMDAASSMVSSDSCSSWSVSLTMFVVVSGGVYQAILIQNMMKSSQANRYKS